MSRFATGSNNRRVKTGRSIIALMLREMSTSYGRSPGGYIWAILEPVGGLTLMTIAFSMAFRSPALGESFALFYATGYLPFTIYSGLTAKIGASIRFSKPLLFYPAVTYMDAIIARFLLNALTQIMVFYIIIAAIIWYFDTGNILKFDAILNAIGMALALGLGIGSLNCFLLMRFPIWEHVWTILNRPLFIISAVFFLFENIPEPYRSYLWYNPLIHVVGEMRRGFYATYDGTYISSLYVYSIATASLTVGFIFLSRYHRELINRH